MRTFEIILLLIATILPFVKRRLVLRIHSIYILLFMGALLFLHLTIEGWRWQMFPAYLLILLLAWQIKVLDVSNAARLSVLRVIGFFGVTVLALIGWVLPMVLPVFSLPEPRGKYKVGTETRYFKTDFEEVITEDPNDKRELVYKIWYPSHGYGSKATGYYALLSELASQGYIIINMNHTYESLGVTFPNRQMKYFDYEFQRKISNGSMTVVKPLIVAFKNGLPYEERHPIVSEAMKKHFRSQQQDMWAKDIIATIDLLDTWNQRGTLSGKMDLNKLGVFGHSVGGGAAGKVPLIDKRVKAASNIDGITWGSLIDTTYQVPFLYISADWPADHEDINSHVYIGKSTDYFYETKLLQSGHPNFMDIPFMIPMQALAGTGSIEPYLGMEIVTKLVTSFFNKHLKNLQDSNPQNIGEQYELLEMTVHLGDSIK